MSPRPNVLLRLVEGEKTYGERVLFKRTNFWLEPRERAVMIGPNGAGKSTLFQCLAGKIPLDGGQLQRPAGVTLVYLPQDYRPQGTTLYQTAYQITPLYRAERGLETAPPEHAGEHWNKVRELSFWKGRLAKTLADFGLLQDRWNNPVEALSGGEGVRLGLAMTFLSGAEVLLLDEPTTHLDLKMRLKLEEMLLYYPGGIALISHDRALVSRVASTVYYLEAGRLFRVAGGFSKYLLERDRIKRTLEKAHHEALKERARLLQAVPDWRKLGADRRANEKDQLEQRARRIQTPDPLPPERRWSLEIAAEGTPRLVLEAKDLSKAFAVDRLRLKLERKNVEGQRSKVEDLQEPHPSTPFHGQRSTFNTQPPVNLQHEVIRQASLRIFRGDRIALVGANGSGKTALLRLLLSRELPDAGERMLGHGVSVAYLDQLYHGLEPEKSLFGQFQERFGDSKAAALLGRVGFRPPRWLDTPQSFSGGERARAGLALLGALRAGLLVMDEPTNHIELELLEALERALTDYPGTILFVSHDRVLVKKVATRFWGIEEGILVEYPSYPQAEAAMLGKPAVRLNPYGELPPEEEKRPEEQDLEDERLRVLQALENAELSERGRVRLKADLLYLEGELYRQYAHQYYQPTPYRHRAVERGLEVFADGELGFWQFWSHQGQIEGEQKGKVFELSGQPNKKFFKAILQIVFELEDAQVVKLGKRVFGRASYLQQLGLPREVLQFVEKSKRKRQEKVKSY